MAATHLNDLMESGQIVKNGIVKLRQFVCNSVNSKRYGGLGCALSRSHHPYLCADVPMCRCAYVMTGR